MFYNRELSKRFIRDNKLPIPLINEELFFYHLNLYENDYGALTKYKKLLDTINEKYNGDYKAFLDAYDSIKESIIQSVTSTDAYKTFNTMDMKAFSITDKPNITSNNIYNQDNIDRFFISVDFKKANFYTLKKIDKNIVLGADTYEDFVGKFTDSDYFKSSKYVREVVFGQMNPSRHITAEKYFITELYKLIITKIPSLDKKAVSLSNDEIIFKTDFLLYNDKLTCFALRKDIEKIAKELGFEVTVEFFHLRGYNLTFKQSGSVRKTFYFKDYFCTDGKFKLISVPLQYHSICYKLFKGLPISENDYHFDYEGIDAKFCEEFDVEKVENTICN